MKIKNPGKLAAIFVATIIALEGIQVLLGIFATYLGIDLAARKLKS